MGLDPALIDAINAVKQRGIISTSELHKLWVVQDFAGVHGGSLRGGAKFGEDFNLLRLSRAAVWHMKAFGGLSMMFEGGCGGVKPVKKFGDVRQAGIDGKVSIEASWGAHGLEAAFGQICAETLSALKQMFGPNIELLLCPSEGDPAAANRYDALLASGYHTPTFHLDRSSKRPTKRRKSDESGASTPSGDGQDDDDGSDDEEEPLDFDGIDEDKPFESLDEVLAFVAAWEETRDQEETSKRLPTVTISVPGDGLGALIHALDSDFMNLLRLGSNVMTRLRPIGRSRNRARIEWYNTRDAWQHYAVTQRATVEHWITADKGASSPSALSSQSSRFEEELESFMIILHSKCACGAPYLLSFGSLTSGRNSAASTTSSATSNTGVGSTSSNVLVDPLGDLHSSLVASGQGMPLPLLERLVLGALVNGALWRDYTPLTETRVGVGQLSTLKMCIVAGSLYATYRVLRQYGFEFVGGRRSFGRSIVYTMGHHGQVVSWDARLPIVTFRPNLGPGMAQLVTSLLSFADSSFNPPLKDYTFPTTPELSNLSTVLAAAPSPILPVPSFPNAETIWRLTVFLRVLPASGMYAADARALVGSAIPGTPLLKSVHLDLFSSSVWDVVGCGKLAPVAREVWKAFIELGQQVGVSQATKFIRWEKADEREEVVDRYELRLEREGLLEDEEDYSEYYTPESFEARRTEMANAIEAKRALLDERKQRHAQVISDLAAELASARGVAPLSQHVLDDLLAPRDQIRDDIVDEVAKIVKDVLKPESPLVFSEGKVSREMAYYSGDENAADRG